MDVKLFHQQVTKDINQLLSKTIENLPSHSSTLKSAMAYSLTSGGKRVRPFLIYASGNMLSIGKANLDMCAIAVECIHAYSLVHDDLPAMDNDDLRRGLPTCHIKFDEATAILAGDALQTLAYETLSSYSAPAQTERVELINILSKASGYHGMCGGQALDLAATNQYIAQNELENIHLMKTGALIEACINMVCALANIKQSEKQSLQVFAKTIGLAFQVKDDILDVTSDTETLGKPQGSDAQAKKSTYPGLLGLEKSKKYLQDLHTQALHALQTTPYNTELLGDFTDYVVLRQH